MQIYESKEFGADGKVTNKNHCMPIYYVSFICDLRCDNEYTFRKTSVVTRHSKFWSDSG